MYWNQFVISDIFITTGLTLTWDVLKYANFTDTVGSMTININMRCIEIALLIL